MMAAPTCPACGIAACLTTGAEVYPKHPDLADKPIWKCEVCPDAYVGCHPGTENALGTPAGPELRRARIVLHRDMVDPIWKNADRCGEYQPESDAARTLIQRAARSRVYAYLAAGLDLTKDECHVGMFSLEQCREAWSCLRGVTYPEIRAWAKARPEPEKKPKKERKAKASKKLQPPTDEERGAAAISAMALRAALADPASWGEPSTMHVDYSRRRRAAWITMWASLPGLSRVNGAFHHVLLPGWQYTPAELATEMVFDLEALAEHGVRPTAATSQGVAA